MKKILTFLFFCLFLNGFINPFILNAQEIEEIEEFEEIAEIEEVEETEKIEVIDDEEPASQRKEVSLEWIKNDDDEEDIILPFRVKNRKFEVGLLNLKVGFSNNFLSTREFFSEKLIIDIDKLKEGLAINIEAKVMPLFFNFNKDDKWGAGLSFGVDAVGIFNISGKLLSFDEAINEKSDVSGAAFLEARYNGFFYYEKVKIKIKPAFFYPIAYIDPDISYTKNDTPEGTILDVAYKIRIYTAWQTEGDFKITAFPGLDLVLGAEYPLSEILGLKEKHSLLDFTIGIDIVNIPVVPAFMNDYMEMSGRIGNEEPIDFLSDLMSGFTIDTGDMVIGVQRTPIFRPFKFVPWLEWRPFENMPLSFTAPVGFMLSPYYHQIFSLEAGIIARLDIKNMFIAALTIGYFDRLWKNGIDLAFNFRIVELDIGMEMRSNSFTKSWSGAGFALAFGLKFGW